MRTIDINITQARLTAFSINFSDSGKPDLIASVALLAGSKKVASFDIRTDYAYGTSVKVPFPVDIAESAASIANVLEKIIVRELNKSFKQLPEPHVEGEVLDN